MSAPFNPTRKQRENLTKLADHLASLPRGYEHFRMYTFFSGWIYFDEKRTRDKVKAGPAECGSVACAIGHGPAAGILPKASENWFSYATRVFGCNSDEEGAGRYMFGVDNPDSVARCVTRIRKVLDGRKVFA